MLSIYKYPVTLDDSVIHMPMGAKILDVQTQSPDNLPFIWVLIDTNLPKVDRHFRVYGTGHTVSSIAVDYAEYVGTFQTHDGALVFHLFDLGEV